MVALSIREITAAPALPLARERNRLLESRAHHLGVGRDVALTPRRRGGRSPATSALLLLLGAWSAPAAQAQTEVTGAISLPWLESTTPADVAAGMQQALAALRPPQHGEYLRTVGVAFQGGHPDCLHGAERRRCVLAQAPVLAAVAATEPGLVEWFTYEAATYLAAGNDCEGAIVTLDTFAALAPRALDRAFDRRRLRIDCLAELQRLAEADRACEVTEATPVTPLQRAQLLAQRGSVNVMLGRLDQATRCLQQASSLVSQLVATARDDPTAALVEFEVLLRQLDLFAAREQFDTARAANARFVARRELDGRPLSSEERTTLRVHDVAADYHSTQRHPTRIDATIERIAELLATPKLDPHHAELLTIWGADLALRKGHHDDARALLQRAAARSPSRRGRWSSAPIASELARGTGADRATLAQHEATLRDVLQEMIAEWREVSWEQESTGFLRLGSRLRILAELVAVTTALHGPERGLQDVFLVQCCTTVSRARGAVPLPLADLRAQLLPAGHGALVFVPAWNESHVFAIDRSQVVHARLQRASELRLGVEALQQELRSLDDEAPTSAALDAVRARSEDLAAALLPASIRRVLDSWHHVTITGGNLLGGVPFECLAWEHGRLLGERFAVATTASLPLLTVLRRGTTTTPVGGELVARIFATLTPAAGFAARNGIADSAALAGQGWERWLANLPPGAACHVETAATVAAWRNSCRTACHDLTILLAHGEQPVDGLPPALGFSPDAEHPAGTLTPTEITAVPQHGLVVIAACLAARGPVRMGDDDVAATLAGAFLFAGADAVVASAAPLRLSLHLEVGAAFTAAMRAGYSPDEALRLARIAAAAGDPAQAFRAGQITLFGWGAERIVAPAAVSPAQAPILALAALLTAVALFGWSRVRRRRRAATARHSAAAAAGP